MQRYIPKGPRTQYLRTLVPKIIKCMVFGTRDLKYWVLGRSGIGIAPDTVKLISSAMQKQGPSRAPESSPHVQPHVNPLYNHYIPENLNIDRSSYMQILSLRGSSQEPT